VSSQWPNVCGGASKTGAVRSLYAISERQGRCKQIDNYRELNMKYKRLGKSGIIVSDICMGTMTFGNHCDEAMALRIMDRAYDAGVDFFATKVAGPSHGWFAAPLRGSKTTLDRHHIVAALEGSLRKLQTDYVDLYQTHWPDHDFPYEETLRALDDLVTAGKVRILGCSNETAWGLTKSLWQSELHGLARYETIQNNFSLNNRRFEDALAQVCRKEQVSLIPYSPLAGGVLSGKYNDGFPDGARFSEYYKEGTRQKAMIQRFVNDRTIASTRKFQAIAAELGITSVTLATAWSKQHDYVASTIVGATHIDQMDEILAAADLVLSADTLQKIDAVSADILYPMG